MTEIVKGFELGTVWVLGHLFWYGVRNGEATENYFSKEDLCEAIRTKSLHLTTLPQGDGRTLDEMNNE